MRHLVCEQSDIIHDFLTKIYKYVDARMADPDALDWEEKHCNANIYEPSKVALQLSEKIEVIFSARAPALSAKAQAVRVGAASEVLHWRSESFSAAARPAVGDHRRKPATSIAELNNCEYTR
jgi:hypothetical protein